MKESGKFYGQENDDDDDGSKIDCKSWIEKEKTKNWNIFPFH